MSDWFYAENDEQKGPLNEAELKEKLATKQLPADTLVWAKGMPGWVEAETVPNFQFQAPPAPASAAEAAGAPALPPKQATPAATTPAAPATPVQPTEPTSPEPAEEHDPDADTTYSELGDIIKKPPVLEVDGEDAEKNKILAIISYVYVLFVVTLVVAPRSPFARYHGAQGLTLFFVTTLYWLFMVSLGFVLANLIPDVILYLALFAPPIALAVIGIINASKGEAKPLPLIGGFTLLR